MIYAPRGVGKTWVALGIAHAIASGGQFLRWDAKSPRRVLYIDGEMPMSLLKDRYAMVVASAMTEAPPQNFRMLAADYQQDGLPDLADTDAQKFYEGAVSDADLIILDNYSTLARGIRENEADSFGPIQSWLLAQRAAGRSVLAIHHAGKGGGQRGTSKKEDVLDTVISLLHPPGYSAAEGARFEVRFTKNRGFWGLDADPFEARFAEGVLGHIRNRVGRFRWLAKGSSGRRAFLPRDRDAHRRSDRVRAPPPEKENPDERLTACPKAPRCAVPSQRRSTGTFPRGVPWNACSSGTVGTFWNSWNAWNGGTPMFRLRSARALRLRRAPAARRGGALVLRRASSRVGERLKSAPADSWSLTSAPPPDKQTTKFLPTPVKPHPGVL